MTPVQTAALCTFSGGLQSPQIVKQGTLKKQVFSKKRAAQKEKEILAVNRRPEQNTNSFPREKGSTQTRILFFVLILV
jgi:hypothetical protein